MNELNMEKQLMNFTAIDFETATGKRYSACAVGIITVENGKTIDEYDSLIQPPDNEYSYYNSTFGFNNYSQTFFFLTNQHSEVRLA